MAAHSLRAGGDQIFTESRPTGFGLISCRRRLEARGLAFGVMGKSGGFVGRPASADMAGPAIQAPHLPSPERCGCLAGPAAFRTRTWFECRPASSVPCTPTQPGGCQEVGLPSRRSQNDLRPTGMLMHRSQIVSLRRHVPIRAAAPARIDCVPPDDAEGIRPQTPCGGFRLHVARRCRTATSTSLVTFTRPRGRGSQPAVGPERARGCPPIRTPQKSKHEGE